MAQNVWKRELDELLEMAADCLVHLWQRTLWPLLHALSFFLVLAAPLLMLLLVLWYLDATGFRVEGGFYKIGQRPASIAQHVATT